MADVHLREQDILVLFEGEAARKSHQELFSLTDAPYRVIERSVIDEVIAAGMLPAREIHIAAGLETILCAALSLRGKPSVSDVLALLQKLGLADRDHSFPADPDLDGIFSLLCREERFDFLRRICNAAKANVESMCYSGVKVQCHLVSDETARIVASSL